MKRAPQDTAAVHGKRGRRELVTVRFQPYELRLIETVAEREGHVTRSDTVREAVREYIERRIPGAFAA